VAPSQEAANRVSGGAQLRLIELGERLDDALPVGGANPRPRIRNRERQRVTRLLDRPRDLSFRM
jgi:hypothetical protein